MKLKLVVASMSILGLVSGPAFAAKTHKMMKSDMKQTVRHDYKDMGIQEPVCTINPASLTMDEMTQNVGRALPNPCNPGWFNRIQVSGGINVDVGKWGNRNANIMGENYQRLSLNDAYINVSADVNDWAKGFASLSFSNPTTNVNPSIYKLWGAAEYNAAYANNINGNASNVIQLEQAYATFGNFDVSPIFVQVGKQFQDYGRYEIHPITESMTQVMTKTLATSIRAGFIANGFHGSIAAFDDPINKMGNTSSPTNYTAAVGYDQNNDQLGFDLGAGYIYNMIGVNDVAYNVVNFNTLGGTLGNTGTYRNRVGAYALYGDVNSGPFSLGARYTQALQRFNVNDLPKNGIADLTGGVITGAPIAGRSGAKPWAAGIQGGYGFNVWDRNQNIYLGYQTSREAAGLNLPKNRYLVGYGIDVWKSTNLGIEWDHDNAYSTGNGGSGNNTNLVSLRAGVQFS
ncbi:LbtU family siderophore porin [Aquicella lusitana]|uniref:Porin n=1 Tax=Aquicella lusitana TaxID=254246 RepID=A0A370GTS7_9COXI|nr:LbtU family siderophore porin [Aquicella lusitana]RDI46879.1 hypothetical protein C8D86_1041 [Aquicella lusitana]VVC73770.1 hypothetical protein AQULUS_15190 [Aquicella lusitana]